MKIFVEPGKIIEKTGGNNKDAPADENGRGFHENTKSVEFRVAYLVRKSPTLDQLCSLSQ
jgi:hypothetical protein